MGREARLAHLRLKAAIIGKIISHCINLSSENKMARAVNALFRPFVLLHWDAGEWRGNEENDPGSLELTVSLASSSEPQLSRLAA